MSKVRFNMFMDAARRIDSRMLDEGGTTDFYVPESQDPSDFYTMDRSLLYTLNLWDDLYYEYFIAAFNQLPNKDVYPGGVAGIFMDWGLRGEDYDTLSKKVGDQDAD